MFTVFLTTITWSLFSPIEVTPTLAGSLLCRPNKRPSLEMLIPLISIENSVTWGKTSQRIRYTIPVDARGFHVWFWIGTAQLLLS
jgi:hypothetical protein